MERAGRLSLFIIVALLFLSLAVAWMPSADPYRIDLDSIKMPPCASHPFGTDGKGRDVLVRVLTGGKISISIALMAALVSASVGFCIGLVSGYAGGRLDACLMALVDFILSFPSLLLAIAISVVMPPGVFTVMLVLSAVGWASFARLIRGHVLSLKELSFVEASRAIGCGHVRIMFHHLAPQCMHLALVMVGIKLGGFVLAEATLGFLGLGAQPPTPTWGSMVSAGRNLILTAPWTIVFPGLAIALTAFCFNMVGEWLKERYEITGIKL